ncbi:TIGR03643 family protein [Tenacibaculum sp. 1_MG-2023]|uniref:TIGR03643 family protein n=1 Tax=Tenacibaculum sp. 1_MG-2023 TaxID=3062653 RepID=UPI0026E4249C|nr:TIGR03643 family protein [Tenacibaculum sp. 1_MG-2023]MDO6599823.1 TIGR03643 family protein [Tenacibaculum sp. 1_MG-2023]
MGKSSLDILREKNFTEMQLDRILEMAWEDRTPFEAILFQFGIPEKDIIKLMRGNLKESSFKRWRKRVNSGVSTKHLKKRNSDITRFKCTRQKAISGNRISKR